MPKRDEKREANSRGKASTIDVSNNSVVPSALYGKQSDKILYRAGVKPAHEFVVRILLHGNSAN